VRGTQPVVLNGERIMVVTESSAGPRYIPGFIWRWMVRTVVKAQRVTIQRGR
jgi:hypothetical protein